MSTHKNNIADLPSRESYDLLEQLGAIWTRPVLTKEFYQPAKTLAEIADTPPPHIYIYIYIYI